MDKNHQELRSLLVAAAHILLSAENAITHAYEEGKTANETIGCIIDVPAKLRDAADIVNAALAIHRSRA